MELNLFSCCKINKIKDLVEKNSFRTFFISCVQIDSYYFNCNVYEMLFNQIIRIPYHRLIQVLIPPFSFLLSWLQQLEQHLKLISINALT